VPAFVLRARLASRRARVLFGVAAASPASQSCAHGFGQRFDLPLPLWLWLTGAGGTIVLTFLLMGLFMKEAPSKPGYPRFDLLAFRVVRWIANPRIVALLRTLAVLLFVLTICAGFIGNQDLYFNLITPMVWVVWWVGVAFACALIGDLWTLINPWRTLFVWIEKVYAAITRGRRLSLALDYPTRLGTWPAVVAFLVFAWAELIWADKNVPSRLAAVALGYSAYTWTGMFVFGREKWLAHGEAFTVAFGVLARFAPIEFVARSEDETDRQLNLRPLGAGLMTAEAVGGSFMAFVILMLATVTFDGFQETALMQQLDTGAQSIHEVASVLFELSEWGFGESRVVHTLTLVAFAIAFLAVFWTVNWISLRGRAPRTDGHALTAGVVARSFVLTLVPIAVAYHLSHYFSLLLTAGQFTIPLASDPFGWGWNLFGTAGYKVNLAIVSPYVLWYSAVSIILIGHVVAVYLAHRVALRLFGNEALEREVPMVLLMVAYTSLSLWILAQPIVG
jgi:hypothetical protein